MPKVSVSSNQIKRVKAAPHGDGLFNADQEGKAARVGNRRGSGALVGPRYAVIYSANRERIRNPNLIYPGQIFVLPTQ